MNRSRTLLIGAIAGALLLAAPEASAQAIAYRHRSTVAGDYLSGSADVIAAQGSFLLGQAEAQRIWVQSQIAEQAWSFTRAEQKLRLNFLNLEYRERLAQSNKRKRQSQRADDPFPSLQIGQSRPSQHGTAWPAALRASKYASSRSLIDGILYNWSPNESPSNVDFAIRCSLATEVGVLRAKLRRQEDLDLEQRVTAIRFLQRIDLLASMPSRSVRDSQYASLDPHDDLPLVEASVLPR